MQVNEDKLNQFMGKVVGEMGAAMNAALVLLGEQLGLYKAMASAGPTPGEVGEARIRRAAAEGGFTRFRRAAETPFNLVYEARP